MKIKTLVKIKWIKFILAQLQMGFDYKQENIKTINGNLNYWHRRRNFKN